MGGGPALGHLAWRLAPHLANSKNVGQRAAFVRPRIVTLWTPLLGVSKVSQSDRAGARGALRGAVLPWGTPSGAGRRLVAIGTLLSDGLAWREGRAESNDPQSRVGALGPGGADQHHSGITLLAIPTCLSTFTTEVQRLACQGHAGRCAWWCCGQLLWLWLRDAIVDYRSHREVPCERRLGGRCGGCLPPLRGPLVGRHLGRGYLGLPGLIVTKTSAVPQQQRHRPREAAVPACQQAESTGHYGDLCPVELQTTSI